MDPIKKRDFKKLWGFVKELNPYVVALFIGLVLMLLPGDDSLYSHIEYDAQLKSMIEERDRLKEQIEEGRMKLDQLRFKKAKLEKYAREHFLMKAEDEDLYILED